MGGDSDVSGKKYFFLLTRILGMSGTIGEIRKLLAGRWQAVGPQFAHPNSSLSRMFSRPVTEAALRPGEYRHCRII